MKRTAVISLLMALCLIASGAIGPAYAQAIKRSSSTTGISSDAQIGILEKRLERLDKLNEEQTRIRQRLMTQLSELGRGIEKLKANPQRGFLADVKLQRLLSEHLKLSKEVEKTEVEIQRNREGRLFIFGQLRETYDKRLAEVVHAMTHEKDRNKALALTHRYFQLREKLKRYQTQPKPDSDLPGFKVKLDPLDGPREINEKIDLLEDRIRKLQELVKKIEKEIQRLKNEMNLAQEMRQMIEERNLFEEGVLFVPSPRGLPVRRPDEAGTEDSSGSTEESGFDTAGVHTSPVETENVDGRASMANAIKIEINRLNSEKAFLQNVILRLKQEVKQFRKKAKEVSG